MTTVKWQIIDIFGFLVAPYASIHHNAYLYLAAIPAWYYFDRSKQLAFHNLTTFPTTAQENLRSMLGLGLKICPTPQFTPNQLNLTLDCFEHNLLCITFYAGQESGNEFDTTMYINSERTPSEWQIPLPILWCLKNFKLNINSLLKKKRVIFNLLRYQRITTMSLQTQDDLIIAHCDNILGPAIIKYKAYIHRSLQYHLHTYAYRQPTLISTHNMIIIVTGMISEWIIKHLQYLNSQERKFLYTSIRKIYENAFAVLLFTYEVI